MSAADRLKMGRNSLNYKYEGEYSAADGLSVGITPIGGSVDIDFTKIPKAYARDIVYNQHPDLRLMTHEEMLDMMEVLRQQRELIDDIRQDILNLKEELYQGPKEARMNNKLPGPSAC